MTVFEDMESRNHQKSRYIGRDNTAKYSIHNTQVQFDSSNTVDGIKSCTLFHFPI